ncbi:hypothetical protein FOL47_000245 [Perkinsus chesapeaki]|uniref:Cyclic nucleotide-binding domain-containing protein n=1 Tax=Perkinsus chesapeaki TaxID=330153 RepID=A0A7J6MN78_PERCH|nr:hypothetical protein FOL47_000245 [Perkinsus chesapeaki]
MGYLFTKESADCLLDAMGKIREIAGNSTDGYQDTTQIALPASQLAGTIPGFGGLGVTEAKIGDVLIELHKFRLELFHAMAQDMAAHHRSIVEEIQDFIVSVVAPKVARAGRPEEAEQTAGAGQAAPPSIDVVEPPIGEPIAISANQDAPTVASPKGGGKGKEIFDGSFGPSRRCAIGRPESPLSAAGREAVEEVPEGSRRGSLRVGSTDPQQQGKKGDSPRRSSEQLPAIEGVLSPQLRSIGSTSWETALGSLSGKKPLKPSEPLKSAGTESDQSKAGERSKAAARSRRRSPAHTGNIGTAAVEAAKAAFISNMDAPIKAFQSNLSDTPQSAPPHPLAKSMSSLAESPPDPSPSPSAAAAVTTDAQPAAGAGLKRQQSVAFSPPQFVGTVDNLEHPSAVDDIRSSREKVPPVKSALEALVAAYSAVQQPKQTLSGGGPQKFGGRGTLRSSGKTVVDRAQTIAQLKVESHAKHLSLDDASSKPTDGSDRWIIYPDGKFRLTWDVAGLLFIVYQGFLVPYTLSFETDLTGFMADLDRCIDIYFLCDIALNFVTGYWNRGVLNLKHRDIVRYYIQTWLFVDLVASIPFDWILSSGDVEDSRQSASKLLRVIRIVKFARIVRLLRLMRIKTLLAKLEEHIDSDIWLAGFTMAKMFLGLFCLSHWIACVWWFIGVSGVAQEMNWIRDNELEQEGLLANKYLRSLFYAVSIVSTMYGDIIASNDGERIFTMVMMLAAGVIFAVVVGSVTNLVVSFGEHKTEYRQRMKRAMKFMRANNVEAQLQVRIKRYIEHLLDNQFEFKAKSELMTMLSDSLQNEVQLTLMGKLLKQYSFFTMLREEIVGRICMICKPIFCAPGDVVFYQGENADGMYFVRKGAVTIMMIVGGSSAQESEGSAARSRFSQMRSGSSLGASRRRSSVFVGSPSASSSTNVASAGSTAPTTKLSSLGPQEYVGQHALFVEEEHESTGICSSFTELMHLKRDELRDKIYAAGDALTLYLDIKAVICLEKGHFDILFTMVQSDEVSVDAVDHLHSKDTLLLLAVRRNIEEVVQFLLNADASVNVLSPLDHCTPLHIAVRQLNVEIVSILLADGASPLLTDLNGDTPISYSTATVPTHAVRRKSLLLPAGTGFMSLSDSHMPVIQRQQTPRGSFLHGTPKIFKRVSSREGSVLEGFVLEHAEDCDTEESLAKLQELRNIFAVALCKHGNLYEEVDEPGKTGGNGENYPSSFDSDESESGPKRSSSGVLSQFAEKWVGGAGGNLVSSFASESSGSANEIPKARDACYSMQELLRSGGVDASYVDPETNETLLLLAVGSSCSVEMISILLDHSADPNDVSPVGGLTPLMLAVKSLITRGAQLGVTDSIGRTPIDLTDDKDMIALLQAMDLHTAARNNDIEACRAAIEGGIDLNWVHPKTGTTALYAAVDKVHEEMVTLLLDGKADPNTAPSTGFSPLYAAANRGVPKMCEILLQYRADPDKKIGNGETPLFAALKKPKSRDVLVKLLLKAGASVNVYSNHQLSPFRVALEKNCDHKLLGLLVDSGAAPDEPNPDTGDTVVCQKPHDKNALPVLKKLVNLFDCDATFVNPKTGATALHYAAAGRNSTAVIEFLIENEADPRLTDFDGRTPVYCAIANQKYDTAKLLLEKIRSKYGEESLEEVVDQQDEINGNYCLGVCVSELNLEMSSYLVNDCFADTNLRQGPGSWGVGSLLSEAWIERIKSREDRETGSLDDVTVTLADERDVEVWCELLGINSKEIMRRICNAIEALQPAVEESHEEIVVAGMMSPISRRNVDGASPMTRRSPRPPLDADYDDDGTP